MSDKREYEYIAYLKLNHVKVGFVDITFRKPHIHREMEMGFVLDGSGVMNVGNRKIKIQKDSMFFINANSVHEIVTTGMSSVRVVYLQISNHFCQDYMRIFRNLEIVQNDLNSVLSDEKNRELRELFLNVLFGYLDNSELSLLFCLEAICRLFRWLLGNVAYRHYDESTYRSMKRKMTRLMRIIEYIDAHYSERLLLSDIARTEGLSETYLSHFIRQNLNMSFQEYLNHLRLEKAVQQVLWGNMTLTDISLDCGFSDIKYMNRLFQKQFGCLPREFKLSHRMNTVQKSADVENQSYVSENMGLAWLKEYLET